MNGGLRSLPNIGENTEAELLAVGITTPEELRAAGSKNAFLMLKARDPGACLSLLCGLEGAIRGVRWHELAPEVKAELKAFLEGLKTDKDS